MKVRTGRTSGISSQTNRVTRLYIFIFSYNLLRQVSVNGFQTIVMTDYYIFAITSTFIFHHAHTPVESSTDGIADIDLNVQSVVHTPPARTTFRSNFCMSCRHAEACQIDSETIWNLYITTVSMNAIIVPVWIKTVSGIYCLFCLNLTNQG